jgi:cytochrome c oxidase assembly factor CtaG
MSGPVLAHGDRTPTSELAGAWDPAVVVLAAAALALGLFAQAFLELRRRGRQDRAAWGRAALFLGGTCLLVLPLVSPLDAVGEEYLLSAHMLQHVLIGDAAAALLVLAVRGPLVVFLLPAPVLAPLARLRPLRAAVSFLLRPRVSLALWLASLAAWHVPAAYDAVLDNQALHDFEHVCFVVTGLLVWSQLLDPARRRALPRGGRLGYAVCMFAAGQVLAMVLLFSLDPFYGAYVAQDERLLGLSPLTDQRLAGAVMMVEQAITLGTFGALTVLGADREERTSRVLSARPRS